MSLPCAGGASPRAVSPPVARAGEASKQPASQALGNARAAKARGRQAGAKVRREGEGVDLPSLFPHQVAGHGGLREFGAGRVLKPATPQEVAFYQQQPPPHPFLPAFIPTFLGVHDIGAVSPPVAPDKPQKGRFLVLGDLTAAFRRPCVLDLKMGTRHFSDWATPEKRARADKKCRESTSAALGFRMSGMKVFHPTQGRYFRRDKRYGRRLREDNAADCFKLFLWDGERVRAECISHFLAAVRDLQQVVGAMPGYRFYSSSLLLIYDAEDDDAVDAVDPAPLRLSRVPSTPNSLVHLHSSSEASEEASGESARSDSEADHHHHLHSPLEMHSAVHPAAHRRRRHRRHSHDDDGACGLRVKVHLIDFAKAFKYDESCGPDPGLLLGLASVAACLENLLACALQGGLGSPSLRPARPQGKGMWCLPRGVFVGDDDSSNGSNNNNNERGGGAGGGSEGGEGPKAEGVGAGAGAGEEGDDEVDEDEEGGDEGGEGKGGEGEEGERGGGEGAGVDDVSSSSQGELP